MEIPFNKVDVFLKQLNTFRLNVNQRCLIDHMFPFFNNEYATKLKPSKAASFSEIVFGFEYAWTRRFAGWDLPRSRYYTLCHSEYGDDKETLKHELFAYYRPTTIDFFGLLDSTVPEDNESLQQIYGLNLKNNLIYLLPGFTKNELINLNLEGECSPYTPTTFIATPLLVKSESIDDVIDLRLPEVAAWFTNYFSNELVNLKPQLEKFEEILPSLLYQQNGGGSFSEIVGQELRKLGAQGLIFPSARSNAYVEIRDENLIDFRGWNFVDYRESKIPDHDMIMDSESCWSKYIDHFIHEELVEYKDVQIIFDDSPGYVGSWKIEGLQEKNKAMKEINMTGKLLKKIENELKGADKIVLAMLEMAFYINGKYAYYLAIHINNALFYRNAESIALIKENMLTLSHQFGPKVFLALDALLSVVNSSHPKPPKLWG